MCSEGERQEAALAYEESRALLQSRLEREMQHAAVDAATLPDQQRLVSLFDVEAALMEVDVAWGRESYHRMRGVARPPRAPFLFFCPVENPTRMCSQARPGRIPMEPVAAL